MQRRLAARLALGVTAGWLLVAVVMGAQASLGAAMTGGQAMPLAGAIEAALLQAVPWIPVTLAVVALTLRFPLTAATWRRHLAVHVVAAPVLAFVANALVVLAYWTTAGRFDGLAMLAQQGAFWAAMRFHIALLVYGAILAATQAVQYWRATRARELHLARVEGQLAQARLLVLGAQMRPHFLFNTLHTIGQLWRSGQHDDADAVLDHLGSLLHKVTRTTAQVEISLEEELELVQDYLAIEQTRFRDRLRAEVIADDRALACPVPPLILQPLVENAVRHGVSATSSAGLVEVAAQRENGTLRITVRDDGPGPDAKAARPGNGMGLRNTRERLAQLYGAQGRLDVAGAPGGGTLVTVEIPMAEHAEGRNGG